MSAAPPVAFDAVTKRFGPVLAVDDVSFALAPGSSVGLVGESGCGESTLARMALGLVRPDSGTMRFHGEPYPRRGRALRALRRRVGIVFQDPYEALDPRFTLRELVAEPLRAHGLLRRGGDERVRTVLADVGLEGAALDSYPGEYSGGQRQRIGIARALAVDPEVLILDEPTSALDVSIQAQILNLLLELQAGRGLAYLFISHDLNVVRRMSDEIIVMYAGAFMERGAADEVSTSPRHPYTRALLSDIPGIDPSRRRLEERIRLGETGGQPRGEACPFSPRCPKAQDVCTDVRPPFAGDGTRAFACHFPET